MSTLLDPHAPHDDWFCECGHPYPLRRHDIDPRDAAIAASLHDEFVREERDRIRRELRGYREKAVRIRRLDPSRSEYITGYADALGDLIDDLAPIA